MSENPWFFSSKTDNGENENVVAIHSITSGDRSQFNSDEIIVGSSISNLGEEQSDWKGYFDELESY